MVRDVDNDFALVITPPTYHITRQLDRWYELGRLVYAKLEEPGGRLILKLGAGLIYISRWVNINDLRQLRASVLAIQPGERPSAWVGCYFHFAMHPPDMVSRVFDVDIMGRVTFGWFSNGYNVGVCTSAEFRRDFKHIAIGL